SPGAPPHPRTTVPFALDAEGNADFDAVDVRVRLETDATPGQFERLRAEAERRCPATQPFVRSGPRSTSAREAAPPA
ncbi:hypothetical protein GTQ99_23630, partial [Kineococcus sp. T13]|uniref:OsmC family protein n=1 Tax=Kineococcus vitellinus TaxID=2696565 RepID=UPI003B8324AF|nr:hypothetical protein [Kineococcus vitellinus]